MAGSSANLLRLALLQAIVSGDRACICPERQDLHDRRGLHPGLRTLARRPAEPARPRFLADFFRGVPTILVIALLGFGAPALQLRGIPTSTTFWGIVALVLVYSAYVSEVYRAGIESVHPSQEAAARSLGLSRGQTLRRVILPQAVRRVIPPLLNDFIGLQKDTALVGTLGAVEAFQQSQIDANATFNYTALLAAAVLFVAITIPLARFTDWLILRDRRKRQAAGTLA
jgi:polar amino acid transport system permease protein